MPPIVEIHYTYHPPGCPEDVSLNGVLVGFLMLENDDYYAVIPNLFPQQEHMQQGHAIPKSQVVDIIYRTQRT